MEYFVLFFPVLVEMDALAAATPTTAEPGAPVVAAAAAAAEGEGAAGDAAPASAPATVHGPDSDPEQPPPANGLDDDGEPQLQPSWRTPQPCPALPTPTPPAPSAPTPTPPSPMSGVEFAGQVLRVNANVAVVALTAPCGATRLCALLRGQVRVNGGARAWEAPLPTLLAVGLPVCVRPRPAAQDEAAACRWVSDELLLEQCVRAPTRVRCAEITRLAGKDGVAKKRSSVPVISIPTIPPERIQEIASLVSLPKKSQLIQRLIAYWTLKRQFRNGVPLLRRLQSSHLARRDDTRPLQEVVSDAGELYRQLKFWQCLRQDLERARLLCELVRKREKLKKEFTKIKELCLRLELCPREWLMLRLLDMIQSRRGLVRRPH